jgi:alkylation response protein AidB-like acyl-CoA dehydrogenase
MTVTTTDLQQGLDLAARRLLPQRDLLHSAAEDEPLDPRVARALSDLGWLASSLSEESGGLGLGPGEITDLCEVAGRRLVPVAIREEAHLLLPLLEDLARSGVDDAGTLAADVLRGNTRGGGGAILDARSASLVAADGGWLVTLDGVPAWLAPNARVVALRGPSQVVLLRLDAMSVTVEPVRALESGQGFALLRCTSSVMGPQSVVDGPRADALLHRHRLALLAECVGVASEVLERSLIYARERTQFGRAIASFQAVSHLLADAKACVERDRSALARLVAVTPPSWRPDADASLLALALCHAIPADTRRVCEAAIQVHGGAGFTWEQGLHLYYRRALQVQVALGGASGSAAAVGTAFLEDRRRRHA